jgi:hypothetical protein
VLRVGLAGLTVLALGLVPKACTKQKPPEPETPIPLPVPVPSATTPPIWHPPDAVGGPAATSSAPPLPPELVKARAAAEAKDSKKVRSLLEKKVRGGKCLPEESQLVYRACVVLKDKACFEGVKAKHPDDITSDLDRP